MSTGVNLLRSVELGVSDLDASARFYCSVWGLEEVVRHEGACYFRASGPEHHVLVLRQSNSPGLLAIELGVASEDALTRLHTHAATAKATDLQSPGPLKPETGGGRGISMRTPDGLTVRISCGVARHEDVALDRSRPQWVTHVVINSAKLSEQVAFFREVLGFRLSDSTRNMEFLRCNRQHHSVAFAHGSSSSLNHIAFEMPDFDGLMRGCGRVTQTAPLEWGVGRHGPANNIFAYFVDPNGFAIEYTTEVQIIDEAEYVPGTPDYWMNFPMRPCRWGMARKPSARMVGAMSGELSPAS